MNLGEKVADTHRFMCDHPGFGYSWAERYGGPEIVEHNGILLNVGDYDCASSSITVWQKALIGTRWEGSLDGAITTHNMRYVFTNSGLFEWVPVHYTQPGDLLLNEVNHVAICQPDGYLSEFSSNEFGGCYGGQRGDQTGWESHICRFYDYPWDGALHYNGLADIKPEQILGYAVNDRGLRYRAHVQDLGWCVWAHDGQTAGTTSFGLRLEAFEIEPPVGVKISVKAHIQNIGWVDYGIAEHGKPIVVGTTGEALRMEMLLIDVVENNTDGRFEYRVHQQDYGWLNWTMPGFATGSNGQERRLEAIEMRLI
jgi:hypothetical protein